MTNLYDVRQMDFQYQLEHQKVQALKNVTFQIQQEEFVCLSGPSGSGKSTLLNLLGLIEPVQKGHLGFLNRELKDLTNREKNKIRKFDLGFIFQSFNLFPVLTAKENVEYFLYRQGIRSYDRVQRVRHSLQAVGLWEHQDKKPSELSGGQKQRVAVARAIAKRPKVIIADEPTASLDQSTGLEIMKLFKNFNQELGTTFIVSSHDPMVMRHCQRHLHLCDGILTASEGTKV